MLDYELCFSEVQKSWTNLRYIPKKCITEDLILMAMDQNANCIDLVNPEFYTKKIIKKYIVLTSALNISKYVQYFDFELSEIAMSLNERSIMFIPNKYKNYDLCYKYISEYSQYSNYIPFEFLDQKMFNKIYPTLKNTDQFLKDVEKNKEININIKNNIIEKLDVLSIIKKGDTFSQSCGVVKHDSWNTAFWRTYNGENRVKTLNYIRECIEMAYRFAHLFTCEDIIIYRRTLEAIKNLKKTYKNDNYFKESINQLCKEYYI
jgi:hypothetical protein